MRAEMRQACKDAEMDDEWEAIQREKEMNEGIVKNGHEVHVLWSNHKLRTVYYNVDDAITDLRILRDKGYKDCYVSCVQVQPQPREAEPLDTETIEALKQCVERS